MATKKDIDQIISGNFGQPEGRGAVRSGDLLDNLYERFIASGVKCSTQIQESIARLDYRAAHEANLRRDVWFCAAEMIRSEKLSNNVISNSPAK